MSSRPQDSNPWPAQTPQPVASSSTHSERRRSSRERSYRPSKWSRQIIDQAAIDEAKERCVNADNAVLSCWPEPGSSLSQNEFTQFVWNSRQPSFAQFGLVDIALYRADTGDTVQTFMRQPNPPNRAGALPIQAGDAWWGANGASWNGSSVPFPFYFVIVQSGQSLLGGLPQATFTATQTTFASSVIASMSSSSAASASSVAAESSSLASLSSAASGSPTGVLGTNASTATDPRGSGGNPGLQNPNGSSSFPHWAIAVITVLGFLALVSFVALTFLLMRQARRRRDIDSSRRGSMGSQSPMIQNVQSDGTYLPSPPLVPPAAFATGASLGAGAGVGALAGAGAGSSAAAAVPHAPPSIAADGASTHSDSPFSGADAAVMAEAFRQALRKPDFAGRPVEEGESPESAQEVPQGELISRELAEEGRDIRSVGSSRGVHVETLSGGGDTATGRDSQS